MAFYAMIRDASEGNSDPCEHIDITTHVAECVEYGSQGQVPTGQPTRFQASGLGDAVAVGEYIYLLSDVDARRYRRITGRVNANTVDIASAFPNLAQATAVDFAISSKLKTVRYSIQHDEPWDAVEVERIIAADFVMLQAQARSISPSPSGTRAQRIAKIADSAVELRIL